MAIETEDMLLRLSPLSPLNLGGLGGGGGSMERQRLKLMREQFEEQKRQNRENSALAKLEEQGRMARQGLEAEQQRAQREAEAQAKTLAEKQKAYQSFSELNGKGDIEGARALVPYMTSLGMGVDLEGEENGLPRYRIEMDAAGARAQDQLQQFAPDGGIGYPADDTSTLDTPGQPGIGSTEEAFRRGQAASAFFDETGVPARAPDQPDLTGGVPKNVIDTGAMAAQTALRMSPLSAGVINAYPDAAGPDPEAYRRGAASLFGGLAGSGLPMSAQLEQFKALQPTSIISSQIQAGAQQSQFDQRQQAASDKTKGRNFDIGYKTLGGELGQTYQVPKMASHLSELDKNVQILENEVDSDDALAFAYISRSIAGDKGATTENDIKRATGMSSQSWLGQVESWIQQGVNGGLNLEQKNAVLGVFKKLKEYEQERAFEFMDKVEEQAGNIDADKAEGLRQYASAHVPRSLRDAYNERKKKTEGAGFEAELDAQSRASGLDPDKVRGVIRPESGGDPSAVNPQSGASGLIQFLPKVAERLGTTIEEVRKMTSEQQLPLVMKYLSERGITAESPSGDYYMAVAAPAFIGKPDSAVVYAKGSKEWEQNPAWRPKDGGDITVGDIKRYGGGKKTEAAPGSDKASRARELLKKGGY